MPKPKTTPDLTPKPYRLLKTGLAAKLSPKSQGGITYLLLADTTDAPKLHIAVTANKGGGLWSKEAVSLDRIEAVLAPYTDQPFPTKALRGAMVGRSSNNPPFCLAVLKDLGLVVLAPDKAHQHVKAGDWVAFRAEWLAQVGEPVLYPAPPNETPDAAEPLEPVTAKDKQRKKGAVEAAVLPDSGLTNGTILQSDEAEHAPPTHA